MTAIPPGVTVRPVDDRGRRASDILNGYRAFHDWDGLRTKWVAIRLSDGGHDGVLYDTKRDAVRHQMHEQQCAYVCFANLVGGASAVEMTQFLWFCEKAYDSGFRLPDPDDVDGGPDIGISAARNDHNKLSFLHEFGKRHGWRA